MMSKDRARGHFSMLGILLNLCFYEAGWKAPSRTSSTSSSSLWVDLSLVGARLGLTVSSSNHLSWMIQFQVSLFLSPISDFGISTQKNRTLKSLKKTKTETKEFQTYLRLQKNNNINNRRRRRKKLNLTFSITTIYRNIKKRQPRKRQKKKQGTRETSVTWIIQSRALRRAKAKFLFSNVFFLSFRRFSFIIDAGLHFLSPTKRSNRREEKTTFTQGFFYSKSKLRYESFAFFMCQCALLSEKAGREERRQKGKLKERKKFYIFRVSRLFARFLYQ